MSRFINLPPEVNNEFIKSLDDESLYRLCHTSRDTQYLCSLPAVWDPDRPSALAPLYMLHNEYNNNWMDFYKNVRKDYVYVVNYVSRGHASLFVASTIKDAIILMLTRLNILPDDRNRRQLLNANYLEYLQQDLSSYLIPPLINIVIGIARRHTQYEMPYPYRSILYMVTSPSINALVPNLELFPTLDPANNMAIISDGHGNDKEQRVIYTSLNNEMIEYAALNSYQTISLANRITSLQLSKHGFYVGRFYYYHKKRPSDIMVLISDKYIDGSDIYRVVILSSIIDAMVTTSYILTRILTIEDFHAIIQYLKKYGTFYRIEDIPKLYLQ